jgi:hypothetical protein
MDVERRLAAWDETLDDLNSGGGETRFMMSVKTDEPSPDIAAKFIDDVLTGMSRES